MSQWITNVTLETSEQLRTDGSVKTVTDTFHIEVTNEGIISQITSEFPIDHVTILYDAAGQLALPPFKEMHNHLDKTYLTLGWRACQPVDSLSERLAKEAEELRELEPTTEQRAAAMIERHLDYGVNHIRTHVNIDPYIKLDNLKGVIKALDRYSHVLTADIIAFPQHGLLRDGMPELLEEALDSGATMLGGLDPAGIDRQIEPSLRKTMEIAQRYQVDVDFHFHDRDYLGYYTMDKWIDLIEQYNFAQKTFFSHAFGLAGVGQADLARIVKRMKRHNIAVMSTAPHSVNRVIMPPIDYLMQEGIAVHLGCDGYFDSWSPYVSGDVLEKLNRYNEFSGKIDEKSLRKSLALVTNGVTPLNQVGQQQWPSVGDPASFVFVTSSCSAEAVARLPQKRQLMHRGKLWQKPAK